MLSILRHPRYRIWIGIHLLAVIVASFFATGYHHPDEYMQIIEFANSKLGGMPTAELPWEYRETMRPWFQPGLFYLMASSLKHLGVQNPFLIWTFFRLFHGLLGWLGMLLVSQIILERASTDRSRSWGIASCAFLYFLPWFFTRASSESLSSSLMIFSFVVLNWKIPPSDPVHKNIRAWAIAGIFAGLSFLARYQLAFMIVGVFSWAIFVARVQWSRVFSYGIAILAMIGVGVLLDSWGYDKFSFSAWNYFYQNVVLNKAAQWGTKPIWAYLYLMHENIMPVLSILLMVAFFAVIKNRSSSLFVWMLVPFFVGHSVIGHKEMRFLFPMLPFIPMVMAHTVDLPFFHWLQKNIWKTIILFLNFATYILLIFWPSRTEVLLQNFLYSAIKSQKAQVFYLERNPYLLGDNPVYFTRPANMKLEKLNAASDLSRPIKDSPDSVWFVADRIDFEFKNELPENGCDREWSLFPDWVQGFNFNHWIEKTGAWSAYRCHLRK